jgi:predicted GNAT family acetyltransferase
MAIEVRDIGGRYEAVLDGQVVGFVVYELRDDRVVLIHTEVMPEAEGKGVASALIAGALDDIRSQGMLVIPLCPFVVAFLKRHAEYADLVVDEFLPAIAP